MEPARLLDATSGKARSRLIIGLTLILVNFLPVMVIVSLAPAVPAMIARFASIPHAETLIPLMVTAPGLVVAIFSPLAGNIIDRVGRRAPLIVATLLYAVFGMAPLLLNELSTIFVARLAVGACETVIIVAGNAMFTDYFDPGSRRNWLTVQAAVNPALAAGFAMLSGILTARAWNGAFVCYAAVLPIAIAIIAFCREPKRHHVEPSAAAAPGVPDAPFPMRAMLLICGVTIFTCALFYVYIVQVGLAFAEIGVTSAAELGRYVAIASLAVPVGAVLFNLMSRRFPVEAVLALSLVLMGGAMTLIGRAESPWTMVAGGMLQQVGAGMLIVALVFWVSRILPPAYRGRGFGMWSAASFAGQFASSLLVGGARFMFNDIQAIFFAMGMLAFAGAVGMVLLSLRPLQMHG